MRSVTLKLTLAFLFVSVIGVLLVAVFVRQQTQREFDRFVLDRYQIDLLDELSSYYARNDSWDEFSAILIRTPNRPGRAGAVPARVTLSDINGTVVYGGLHHEVGDQLSKASLCSRFSPETTRWNSSSQ